MLIKDGIRHHPKHLQIDPSASWLWVCAIDYARQQLTDGWLPDSALDTLGHFRRPAQLVAELERVGLFQRDGSGWQIKDFLEFNDSKTEVLRKREAAKERQARSRQRHAVTKTSQPCDALAWHGTGTGTGVTETADQYWEAWREVAQAHGVTPYLSPRATEFHHLGTVAKHCPVADWRAALEAWWSSPHVTGRNLGLAVSQLPELLAYVTGDAGSQDVPFRAPPDRPAKPARRSSPPPTSAYDPDWRRACTHDPRCTHPAQCARRAEIDAVKAVASAGRP